MNPILLVVVLWAQAMSGSPWSRTTLEADRIVVGTFASETRSVIYPRMPESPIGLFRSNDRMVTFRRFKVDETWKGPKSGSVWIGAGMQVRSSQHADQWLEFHVDDGDPTPRAGDKYILFLVHKRGRYSPPGGWIDHGRNRVVNDTVYMEQGIAPAVPQPMASFRSNVRSIVAEQEASPIHQ
jgi:hypothetical protein